MVALLETIGIQSEEIHEPLQLEIPKCVQEQSRQILQSKGIADEQAFAVIHPGTARSEKYWSPSSWAAVAEYLIQEKKLHVVITGGGDAEEILHIESIKSFLKPESLTHLVDLSNRMSLPQTASVIEQSQLALGVDTAAMHLAAAFEIPQLILYGPTNPYRWRPLHDHAHVILAGHETPLQIDDYEISIPDNPMSLISEKQVINALNDTF